MACLAMILKSETYHFHRLDLTRQPNFVVTVYNEAGMRLTITAALAMPTEDFTGAQKCLDTHIEGPRKELAAEDKRRRILSRCVCNRSDTNHEHSDIRTSNKRNWYLLS